MGNLKKAKRGLNEGRQEIAAQNEGRATVDAIYKDMKWKISLDPTNETNIRRLILAAMERVKNEVVHAPTGLMALRGFEELLDRMNGTVKDMSKVTGIESPLSIVLPFYKRPHEFSFALDWNAPYFAGHEVVLVLDDPEFVEMVLEKVKRFPMIKWKVILNEKDHEWRNPSKAINVGICQASNDLILVLSPECLCITNVPMLLSQRCLDLKGKAFVISHVGYCTYDQVTTLGGEIAFDQAPSKLLYGSICVSRTALFEIQGYDESNLCWGADDDNLRARLRLAGYTRSFIEGAKVLHPTRKPRSMTTVEHAPENSAEIIQRLNNPTVATANDAATWGRDFDKVIYSSHTEEPA